MKRNTFLLVMFVMLQALVACGKPEQEPKPTPDPTPDPKPIVYRKANTHVVYECNERLFAQNEAFKAIDAYVPTLRNMQVDVLWLMPIHERGVGEYTCGSPYCVHDFKGIDKKFGTLDDLKALVKHCHDQGMFVILDWVANHTSRDNAWYVEHEKDGWYTTPRGEEVNWKDVVPLNYNNKDVRAAMTDALLYWVREADIDGYRCDYAEGVPTDYWTEVIAEIRKLKPEAIMLAESSKTEHYAAGFDWLYSWNYLFAVQKIYSTMLPALYAASKGEFASTPAGKDRLRYVTTHDASSENAPSKWYKNAKGELAASCLTFFLGGVPMIYSSQEIGDVSQLSFFNYKIMNFTASNATRDAYAALMKAYVKTAEARYGEVVDYSTDHVAIFTRSQGEKSVLVIVNASASEQDISLPLDWQRIEATDALTGAAITTKRALTIAPYEYLIYSR